MDLNKVEQCGIYARVSLDEAHGQDLDRQLFPLRELAAKLNLPIRAEFVERESGADMFRPQFLNALTAFRKGEIQVLLVLSLDRLARFKPYESLFFLDRLAKQGLKIVSLYEPWFDMARINEPAINLHTYITFWKAWAEREDTKARARSGIAAKQSKREYRGGRPKGSKDTKARDRRWKVKPQLGVEDLVHINPSSSEQTPP